MSKKLYTLMAILVAAVMILAACAPAAPATTEAPPEATEAVTEAPVATEVMTEEPVATEVMTEEPVATEVMTEEPAAAFRVGFVTDTGGIDDGSFNTTQWNGVLRAQDDLGIEAQFIQSDEASQYEPNLTEFASQGYDLVIAAGFLLGGAVANVAAQYPDVQFSIVDYAYPDPFGVPEGVVGNAECIPNVQGQVFKTDQAAYLAGYLAAGMSETGKIGYFGGMQLPTVTIFGVGFQMGMDKYNEVHGTAVELIGWSNEEASGLFTGDFADLTKGKENTESLFDEGADIFIPVGGLIGTPGFDVARERGGYGIWVDVDGYNMPQLESARDVLLTSVMKNMDNSVYDVIQSAMEGNFNGCGVYIGDLTNGGVGIAPYHDLESAVPDELKTEIEDLQAQIISGEISDTGCISFPGSCPGGLYETP
jgi:basic membrane protein A